MGKEGENVSFVPNMSTFPLTKAIGRIDEDGSRYLMSDVQGSLYLLVLAHNGEAALGIKIEILGGFWLTGRIFGA
jgi:hypothetical protein